MVLVQDGHIHGIKPTLDIIGSDRKEALERRGDVLKNRWFTQSYQV